MKVLVTGAAGFIGSHLVHRLLDAGHEVRALDDLSTGRRENLSGLLGQIEFREGDLADPAVCVEAVRGQEAVFHQAAIPSVPRSVAEPEATHRANLEATFRLLLACRAADVRRVVYAASSSVYGDSPTLPKHEQMPPSPRSPYALHKYVGEEYGRLFHELYALEFVALRYFNVFGPRQDPASEYSAVIPKFISLMLRGQRPTIYGDGQTSRDFTYIANVVDANLLALHSGSAPGHSINAATGCRISLLELVAQINELLGTQLEPVHAPDRIGDVKHSQADIRLACELLGYSPRIGFEEGLRLTLESLRA